mmetsp:Transcript_70043/g.226625  ORF Transcript_70043/g.226625 Transcript_70043/m.226625 type:complete len:246 (+) Transcript_70043:323-1060(+)
MHARMQLAARRASHGVTHRPHRRTPPPLSGQHPPKAPLVHLADVRGGSQLWPPRPASSGPPASLGSWRPRPPPAWLSAPFQASGWPSPPPARTCALALAPAPAQAPGPVPAAPAALAAPGAPCLTWSACPWATRCSPAAGAPHRPPQRWARGPRSTCCLRRRCWRRRQRPSRRRPRASKRQWAPPARSSWRCCCGRRRRRRRRRRRGRPARRRCPDGRRRRCRLRHGPPGRGGGWASRTRGPHWA